MDAAAADEQAELVEAVARAGGRGRTEDLDLLVRQVRRDVRPVPVGVGDELALRVRNLGGEREIELLSVIAISGAALEFARNDAVEAHLDLDRLHPVLGASSNSLLVMRREALVTSGVWTPTPEQNSFMPPPVPVDSTIGVLPDFWPKRSATAVVNGNTVDEPVIWMRSRAAAGAAAIVIPTASTAADTPVMSETLRIWIAPLSSAGADAPAG